MISLHVSFYDERERHRCWCVIIKPAEMGSQALPLSPRLCKEMCPSALPHGLSSGRSDSMHISTNRVKKKCLAFHELLAFPLEEKAAAG